MRRSKHKGAGSAFANAIALIAWVSGVTAGAAEPTWVDARASLSVQTFQQALVPGVPGLVAPIETALPFTLTGYVRFLNVDLPGADDALSGEVAAWARGGPRDGTMVDGDVSSAYAQARFGMFRVKLGRQVALPGAARYVRFDGANLGLTYGMLDVDAYAGLVALPRWNQPRGVWMLGFVGDALEDPRVKEAQNRAGHFTLGARVGLRPLHWIRGSLAFHEQHDAVGASVRVASADLSSEPFTWLAVGGRATLDLRAAAFSEAKVWADLVGWDPGTASIDYAYQSPSLLLPQTSILAAFGGANWHEAGGEVTVRLPGRLRLTGRGAAQLYEGDRPGGRGLGRLRWEPGFEGRWMVLAEGGRVLVSNNGLTQFRLAARLRATKELSAAVDTSLFLYDRPIAGVRESLTGSLTGEWAATRHLRFMVSATALRTPWAAVEFQGLARVVFLWDPVSTGGLP